MKLRSIDFIVLGLGFGDEGKGAITDYLVEKFRINSVIRFNGGSQAAHTVVTPDGISHTFSQFGSGMFVKGTRSFLSSQMLIDPYSLLEEEFVLKRKGISDAFKRLVIDSKCRIITPYHKMIGQMQELARGKSRFGSTGKGVGEAVLEYDLDKENTIYLKDFFSAKSLQRKLEIHYLKQMNRAFEILSQANSKEVSKVFLYFKNKYMPSKMIQFYQGFAKSYSKSIDRKGNYLEKLFDSKSSVLLEGAQGALLDPEYGFVPYITKTKTTLYYAQTFLNKKRKPICIGVLRAYSHRHGMGPLPTESISLSKKIQEEHNTDNPWQGAFRFGWLDLILCRYAIQMNSGLDTIALTCIDQLSGLGKIKVCTEYQYKGIISKEMAKFFQYKREKDIIRITDINPILNSTDKEKKKLTEILFECKPYEYLEFKGWKKDIAKIESEKDLPENLKTYLHFLESKEGFGLSISILSFGKTRRKKILLYGKIL